MKQSTLGTVKWFSPSKGYGFILNDNNEEIFVHHNDVEMSGYRYLRRGQRVSFQVTDNNGSLKATDVSVVGEAQPKPDSPPPVDEKPSSGHTYQHQANVAVDEDREHEFKSLNKSKNPIRTISDYYVEEYVNAFLNTSGGVLFFGIEDDGRVVGLRLDRSQRDRLRLQISRLINKFQPSVEPDLYNIKFVPVQGAESTYVVELRVAKGTANLYMTGSQNFYIRRDGSNFMMSFDMIRARLQAPPTPMPPAPATRASEMPDASAQQKSDETLELDLGILLALVFMSWSDENLSAEEIQLLKKRARDEGLEENEVKMLHEATLRPPLLETIATYLPTPESRNAAATVAYLTALTDSILTENELAAFDKMCQTLQLSQTERKNILRLGEQRIS